MYSGFLKQLHPICISHHTVQSEQHSLLPQMPITPGEALPNKTQIKESTPTQALSKTFHLFSISLHPPELFIMVCDFVEITQDNLRHITLISKDLQKLPRDVPLTRLRMTIKACGLPWSWVRTVSDHHINVGVGTALETNVSSFFSQHREATTSSIAQEDYSLHKIDLVLNAQNLAHTGLHFCQEDQQRVLSFHLIGE